MNTEFDLERWGAWACMGVGLFVACAALVLILYSVVSFWGYLGLREHLIHLVLFFVALGGVGLFITGRRLMRERNAAA